MIAPFNSLFVGKLTAGRCQRQTIVAFGRLAAVSAGLFLSSIVQSAISAPAQWQATTEISAAAEVYLKARMGAAAPHTTVRAGSLDSRHRLALCSVPLESFLRRGTRIKARTIVGVRCNGSKPWKVYVPVDVIVTKTVLVAKRTLPRGHLLSSDDLVIEPRDVSRLLSGFVAPGRTLQGQRLKTQLIAGRILTPGMLRADIAIRRGQTVTLMAGSGAFAIQASGTALMDGAMNQRIRVENTTSGRVIEGIVTSREHVQVLVARQ